ncbi:hypothetical protein ACHAW6_009723 [Cyclotella cf. meneghiniana]
MILCCRGRGGGGGLRYHLNLDKQFFWTPVSMYDTFSQASSFVISPSVWHIEIDDTWPNHFWAELRRNLEFHRILISFCRKNPDDFCENMELGDETQVYHETLSELNCILQILIALITKDEKRVLVLVRSANDSPQDLSFTYHRIIDTERNCLPSMNER